MKMTVYCIYDKVAQAALPTFTSRNDAEALRFFDHQFQNAFAKDSNVHLVPQDFDLLKLGYFEDSPVQLTPLDVPECISRDYTFTPRKVLNAE